MIMMFFCLILSVLLCICQSESDGWKMTDRFYGFRYEIHGNHFTQSEMELIQSEADNFGCFGWVQMKSENILVGMMK